MLDLAKYSKELSKLFELSDNILLISHINPDGDTIGSQLALYRFLLTKGKIAAMISPNYLQEFLKWMDDSDLIKIFIKERAFCKKLIQEADLIIMVDFNQPNRLGGAERYVKASAAPKVIIDHHIDPQYIADLLISDTSKCSTAELVHELITTINGKPFIEKSYAEDIYVGIITDTGNFEYGSYSGSTLRLVADLLEAGIEREKILRSVYYNFTTDRMRLQGFALNNRMVVIPEYGAAYIYLSKKDLAEYNHVNGDTEGFVNLPLSIKGIRFSVLFIEKENFVKMSFRSRGSFAVNEFATKYFSGGGHLNASGGEFQGTLENAVTYFLNILKGNEEFFKNQQ